MNKQFSYESKRGDHLGDVVRETGCESVRTEMSQSRIRLWDFMNTMICGISNVLKSPFNLHWRGTLCHRMELEVL
jgi:hypothetical protein